MICRDAIDTDLENIMRMLHTSNLPSVDCEEHLDNFIIVEVNNKIIGIGGLEVYGNVGLLRSIVVDADSRKNGVGEIIYTLIAKKASNVGVNILYLLTESAEKYFSGLGFSVLDRDEIPASIKETKQFKELCPSSAKVMSRVL